MKPTLVAGVFVVRLAKFGILFALLVVISPLALADAPSPEVSQLLPERSGTFKRVQLPTSPDALRQQNLLVPENESLGTQAEYVDEKGNRFLAEIVRFHQDAEAYSLLSIIANVERQKEPRLEILGGPSASGFSVRSQVALAKGPCFLRITPLSSAVTSLEANELAKSLSASLDQGEGDIPVLIKHLPNSETAQKTAIFLTRFNTLQTLMPNETVLSEVQTGGDADAVLASYDSGKVLIVEYNTPQLATENDQRITAKIQSLWQSGQRAPKGYRRVGNYSVFVFDAQTNEAAKQLLDKVKYEQVVQWLGENPYLFKEAERRYVETTLGVFVAVVKASGVALVTCFGLGGLFGALLFTRRRSRQQTEAGFSDAGGMMRLNLDEMTPQPDPARLIRERN
ncbi:MAG TPA: hypothetical protein VKB46_02315 [Pyrinomonadaceae bacterium]|nr:hypothetical protein [Pyrinomonadaceae bacterium]